MKLRLKMLVKMAVEELVQKGKLGLNPKYCKVFLSKGYRPRDGGKEIAADVSIEWTRPGASEPMLVWIWECRNYREHVNLRDVEEFHARLGQIRANVTKGSIVTVGRCTMIEKAARKYANSRGIGVFRILNLDAVKLIHLGSGPQTRSRAIRRAE